MSTKIHPFSTTFRDRARSLAARQQLSSGAKWVIEVGRSG